MASPPAFRLLTSLDITGSMSSEIEGVKQAVAGLVDLTRNLEVPLSYAISTFTEGGKHCCTSLAEFVEPEAALEYVQGIKCCQPPEEPHLSKNGDDGPENTKAALVRLTDLEPGVPTIAFLITDAPPHLQSHGSHWETHRAELAWLQQRGLAPEVAGDVFKVVESVVKEHFGPSLLLNCVLYSTRQQELQVYGQLAQAMGGMLMRPTSRQPEVLAQGLLSVVRALLARLLPEGALGAEAAPTRLEGFELYDTSRLEPRASEEEPARGTVACGDGEALFAIAMERMEAVVGSKWSKRAVGMTAPALQLEFVWRTARFVAAQQQAAAAGAGAAEAAVAAPFASRDAELAGLLELRQRIVDQLPEESRGHFSIEADDISAWAAEAARSAATGGAAGAAASCISLATVGDELSEEADWEDWLATVMRLLQGFPLRLQLPLDKLGNPDFMDAWSAVVQSLGVDRITSAEFMALVGPHAAAKGPTDGSRHNALLVVVHPGDTLAALVFKAASGTQVLNYVSGVLMGARGFLPNLHTGTAASCLVGLLSSGERLTTFRWDQALAIVHTLRCTHRPAARAIAQQLAAGKANPADPAPKFVAALLSLGARLTAGAPGGEALGAAASPSAAPDAREQLLAAARLALEEWMAALVQRHFGKRSPESDADYLASLQQYLPLQLLLPECGDGGSGSGALDPLCVLHPLEEEQLPLGRVNPEWQAAAVRRLRGEEDGVPAHPALVRFEHCAAALLTLLLGADASSAPASEEGRALLAACWPEWEAAFITALLLRQRTARYNVTAAEAAAGSSSAASEAAGLGWERVEVAAPVELALGRAREALAGELAGYKKVRAEAALQQLLAAAVEVLQAAAAAGADAEAASAALKELYVPLGPARTAAAAGTAGAAAGAVGEGAAARPESAPSGPVATLLDQTVCLDRSSVPSILERLLAAQQAAQEAQLGGEAAAQQQEGEQAPTDQAAPAPQLPPALLCCLVAGSWTTVPPQALRNCQLVRQLALSTPGCEDLLELITAREVCTRATGHNRHGHSATLNYPGPAGWTKEYGEQRVAAVPKVAPYVEMMRRFTEMAGWARGVAARQGAKSLMEAEALLAAFEDANFLPVVLMRVEELVGESMPGGR